MADGPAVDVKTTPPPAEVQTGQGADTGTAETQNAADKSRAEKAKALTKSWVSKLTGFKSSGNPEGGLRDIATTQPETSDAKAADTPPSAESDQAQVAQGPQAPDTDNGTKPTAEASPSPSDPKGEKPKDEDADLQDKLPQSDWEEYKVKAAKIAQPSRRLGGLLRPSAKAQAAYTNARQDLKQEYIEKHASAQADQDTRATSTGEPADTTAVTSGETQNQPEGIIGPMPENASAEDLQRAFDASPSAGQTELPQDTSSEEGKSTKETIGELKARLDAKEISQEEYTRLATEAVSKDVSPPSEEATPTADSAVKDETGPSAPETPKVPDTVDEVLEKFKETPSAADPVAEANVEAEAKAKEARRGTDDRYQELVKQMIDSNGDPTKMSIEDQRELVGYQEQRLKDMQEGLRAADGSVPIEAGPTGPATPEDILTKSGVTQEQLADILNSPQGEALAQAMQENPEQAQAILKEIAKAQEMQTQLKALCEAQGWPFDAKQGMEFALGRIAAQLGNEMASADVSGSEESRKKWTILKVLLLALGIPLVIAAAAVAAEASLITSGAAAARQAA